MPASTIQVFVRGLDGRTRPLDFHDDVIRTHGVSLGDLGNALAKAPWGAPLAEQLVSCGAQVHAPAHDPTTCLSPNSSFHLLLRLDGGKGGFGSLLRGAGTSGAATTNQDACRDLSGRRIRHVEAEKKLREHARNAPQRELEAAALKHINSKGNQIKRKFQEIEEREKERYANESGAVIGNVEDAVLIGVAAERKNESQQKKSELDAKSKKPVHTGYMGLGLGGVSDDSDDSDEDMDEASVLAAKKAKGKMSKGGVGKGKGNGHENKNQNEKGPSTPPTPVDEATKSNAVSDAGELVDAPTASIAVEFQKDIPEIDFSTFDSAGDLEIFGLDVLKHELMKHGLKCGGTLAQRAERLFLLKNAELCNLDAKHKAKPSKK